MIVIMVAVAKNAAKPGGIPIVFLTPSPASSVENIWSEERVVVLGIWLPIIKGKSVRRASEDIKNDRIAVTTKETRSPAN
jgi:hypothetical protein